MALSAEEKVIVAQYVTAGLIVREVADRLLSGRVTKTENSLFKSLVRVVGRAAGRAALGAASTAGMVARRHPVITAGTLAYIAHTQGVTLETARAIAEQELETWRMQPQFFLQEQLTEGIRATPYEDIVAGGRAVRETLRPLAELAGLPGVRPKFKRKVSKANRAVKQGMTWLKSGTKAATGAAAGTLPGRAFRTAVKAAGLANPKTKSKPGKGKSMINKLARRLKKWW